MGTQPGLRNAASLERTRKACTTTAAVAFVLWIGMFALGASVTMPPVQIAALIASLLAWLVFAGSVARLEIASGSGILVGIAVFIIAAACPPWFGLPLCWLIDRRIRDSIQKLKLVGVCWACGYDLAGLAAGGPCPECGAWGKT